MDVVFGLDLGATNINALAVGADGQSIASAFASTPDLNHTCNPARKDFGIRYRITGLPLRHIYSANKLRH